ncbi:hypothetical protein DM01DRAFT_1382101 [Hesseltinella vesiculosa]|uniref:SAP domain-containing protein n=1 Tax=Hesseltinella vesiculosa TaxID=101127 RepID=A0A1X2GPH7_9FUNG|nr:hypothetical protein DM01DRAFT_1382101 [Hesseltinella vesiculosa]
MISQRIQHLQASHDLDQLSSSLPSSFTDTGSTDDITWEALLDNVNHTFGDPRMEDQTMAMATDDWLNFSFDQPPPQDANELVPQPALSQSLSPLSEMSMNSPQNAPGPLPLTSDPQLLQLPFQNDMAHRGHRRRRSSSVPSLFYSMKRPVRRQETPPAMIPPLPQQELFSPQLQPSTSLPPYHAPPPSFQAVAKAMPIQIQRRVTYPKRQAPPKLSQQQLDHKLLNLNFDDVTVAELKELLRERGLSIAGRKAELTDRLAREKQRVVFLREHPGQPLPADLKEQIASPPPNNTSPAMPAAMSTQPAPLAVPSQSHPNGTSPILQTGTPILQLTSQMDSLDFSSPVASFAQMMPAVPIPPAQAQPEHLHHPAHPHLFHQTPHHPYQQAYEHHLSSSLPMASAFPSHHFHPPEPLQQKAMRLQPGYLDPTYPSMMEDMDQHINFDDQSLADFLHQDWQ